jgi:hypothetical protein
MSEAAPPNSGPMAGLHLRLLAPGVYRFTFQSYTDCREKRDEYKMRGKRDPLARILHGTLAQHWGELTTLSTAGAGIYVTINETDFHGRAAANIVCVRAYFSDLDGAPLDNLLRFTLRPHFVVHTSDKRFHPYFLIGGASLGQFKTTQQKLAKVLEGDLSVCDLPRVLRLAGFPNQKDPARPFPVTIAPVPSAPQSPYGDAEFQAALAAAEKNHAHLTKPAERQNLAERSLASQPSGPPDMRQGFPDGRRTHELTRRAGWCLGARNMSEGETVAACLEWNQFNTPPLSEEKVRSTVASIAKAEAKKREQVNEQQKHHRTGENDRGPKAEAEQRERVNEEQKHHQTGENEREPTQREKLISIGLGADLWHDKDINLFATVEEEGHHETYGINSRTFRNYLMRRYGEQYLMKIGGTMCPSAPSTQSLSEAIAALGAKAARGVEYQAAVRVGEDAGMIYLDLGTPEWTAVEISANGWQIIARSPVRFVRPPGFRALPVPVKGGDIRELSHFLNFANPNDFLLVVAWLIAALRSTGPFPVLVFNGEQGSGKTLACRVLRRLIDPNGAELRSVTSDERDLLLAAKNGWVVALDNLSYVRNDLSDALCRIATKGAFATRCLYTNDEEFLLEVCRPVLLNGIPSLASRADLADRAIVCVCPIMSESKRRSEREFWADFDIAAPRILGALLNAASGALRSHASITLAVSCRMMDFATWAEAGCRALGCQPGAFETAYKINRSSSGDDAVDADPVAGAVVELVSTEGHFRGTATDLLTKLESLVIWNQRGRTWPKDAPRLSGHLRRLHPLLRPRDIEIDFDQRSNDAARRRLLEIKKVERK